MQEFTGTLYASDHVGVASVDPGERAGAGPMRTVRGEAGFYLRHNTVPFDTWELMDFSFAGPTAVERGAIGESVRGAYVGFRCVY